MAVQFTAIPGVNFIVAFVFSSWAVADYYDYDAEVLELIEIEASSGSWEITYDEDITDPDYWE